ncbi:MAG: tryptophan 7-halogenase, partial [Bdellovibrionaceae bacterium]|nr:tryptophan 7-halogenase [Pseudobdellovibrionaceae bacterium]
LHPNIKTQVIESSKIPVIGVGESTTTEIVPFLHRTLGIDPEEFFREVKPTMKLGIRFEWGPVETSHFNFNFFAGHQHESYFFEKNILNANWPSVLMTANKMPIVRQENGRLASLLGSVPFSYHIDNKSLIKYLRKQLQARKINIIDAEVINVHLDEREYVASLETDDGQRLKFDLYVDCSGFRSKILGQALGTEFISYKSTLRNNKALTFDRPNNGVIDTHTTVRTMDNGWCWTIPMREENHHGYVHSTEFCDEATALKEVRAKFGDIQNYKMIDFKTGRHVKAWNRNVFGLGNSYGFVEPLESTAIQTAVHSIMTLCRLMPKNFNDTSAIAGLNQEIAATWDTFRWFLGMHYKFNTRLDTPYWKHCRANTEIGDAQLVIDLFQARPPLSASNFGSNSPFTALEALVFNSYSYDTLLFGQNLVKEPLAEPLMTRAQYDTKLASYAALTEKALSQHELFENDYLFSEGILEQLFEEQDTWITETEA